MQMNSQFPIPAPDAVLTRADVMKLAGALEVSPPAELRTVRLAVLATFTADMLRPYLAVEAARCGMALTWWAGPYGQVEQQVIDPGSGLYAERADVILMLLRLADLAAPEHRFLCMDAVAERERLKDWLAGQLQTLRAQSGAAVLVSNFAPPEFVAAGLADAGYQAAWVHSVNAAVTEVCAAVPRCYVLDVARAAGETGLARWRDDRLAYIAKAPMSGDALAAVAKLTARTLRAFFTLPKKCLVVDMDNTLWGGVIGEAGMEGIALGPDYPGNVFVDFQKKLLSLRDRGILLAAASKNNSADVEAVLAEHPSCLLKRGDFAAWEVHWDDKATSMRRIAQTLNVGLDALVFADDNPVERAWVRGQTPEVTVLEMPASPMGYWKTVDESGCFDALTLTAEDRQRAAMYGEESQRQELQATTGNIDDFLRSLNLVLTVGRVDEATLPRVAQLMGKTNQFNLTTRRHDEAAIRAICVEGAGLWVKVRDRFGDAGLVGVVLAVPEAEAWKIDTLLMSCRVIGRKVETAMLALLERIASASGVQRLTGEFIPTKKNQPAANFLPEHGFTTDGGQWQLQLDAPRALPDCFIIENQTGLPIL